MVDRESAAKAWRTSAIARLCRRAALCCTVGVCLALASPLRATAAGDELVVAAAASLRAPLADAVRRLESKGVRLRVLPSFGASNVLARQIEAGAPIDVFLSADEAVVDALVASGSVRPETRRRLAANSVVLLVSAAVAERGEVFSWRKADVLQRLALPDDAVPLGAAGRVWLASAGMLDALSPRLVRTDDSRATLAAVENGHVDAAIVWSSDARLARRASIALRPQAGLVHAVVTGVVTTRAADPVAASALLDALASEAGRDAFAAAGFEPIAEPR